MNSEIANPKIINCYLILGLDYDDESLTSDLIESTIKNKNLEWGRRKNTEPLAEKYIELIGDIKNIMSDPILRAEHADAARELLGNTITKELLRNSKNNNINKTQLERISNFIKTKFENTDNHRTLLPLLSEFKLFVENKAKKIGIEVTEEKYENSVDYNKIYNDEWKNEKPEGKDFFDDVHTQLKNLGYSDLYSFLGKDSRSPLNTLIDEANNKLNNKLKSKADQTITANLCHNANKAFKDEKNREIYNKYLIWSEKNKILDELVLFVEINKELTPEYKKEALTKLSQVIGSNRAQNLLTAFCIYNPKIAAIGIDNRPLTPIKICRSCKRPNTSTENCDGCGFPFHMKCPQCGSDISLEFGVDVCKSCGFNIKQIDTALSLIDEAEKQIKLLNFSLAEKLIIDSEKYWPNNNEVEKTKKYLYEMKAKYASLLDKLNDYIKSKEFFAAKKEYENVKSRIPGYENIQIKEQIDLAISESDSYYNEARTKTSEEEILRICSKAASICMDNKKIQSLVLKYPPEKPSNLHIVADTDGRRNILKWDPSPSKGDIHYYVVRKEDNAPTSENDGNIKEMLVYTSYTDNKVEPGVAYYYAIFTERAGIFSNPLYPIASPLVGCYELQAVNVTPGNASVKLTWSQLPKNAKLEIYRKSNANPEIKLSGFSPAGYIDTDVSNDVTYTYRFSLVYNINGSETRTKGIVCEVTPTSPPKPITSLNIKSLGNGSFEASWENPEKHEVCIYGSPVKLNYDVGDTLSLSDLNSKMVKIPISDGKPNTAIIKLPNDDNATMFVTAAIVKSSSVTIGNFRCIRNITDVEIKDVQIVNNKLTIWVNYRKGITGFKVIGRYDSFASNPYENAPIEKYFSVRSITADGSNRISMDPPAKRDCYITVFAESRDTGDAEYSEGCNYLFKNISKETLFYSVKPAHIGLFGTPKASITFISKKKGSHTLPEIDIYSAHQRPPMFKSSASLFQSIPSREFVDSITFTLDIPKGTLKNTFIRPYLHNENEYNYYSIELMTNSECKII